MTLCEALRLVHNNYDATQCVVLRCLHVDVCRNTTQCQDRFGFYPCIPLCCILAADRQKKALK